VTAGLTHRHRRHSVTVDSTRACHGQQIQHVVRGLGCHGEFADVAVFTGTFERRFEFGPARRPLEVVRGDDDRDALFACRLDDRATGVDRFEFDVDGLDTW
jgi:hypothetical protein